MIRRLISCNAHYNTLTKAWHESRVVPIVLHKHSVSHTISWYKVFKVKNSFFLFLGFNNCGKLSFVHAVLHFVHVDTRRRWMQRYFPEGGSIGLSTGLVQIIRKIACNTNIHLLFNILIAFLMDLPKVKKNSNVTQT